MSQTGLYDPGRRHPHSIFYYLMGDCQYQLDYCDGTPLPVQMIFWFLRGIGAPIFLNNPLSGLLILIAMFIAEPWIACCASIGLTVAMLTAIFLGQDRGDIVSGGCTFHGMLCGIVCAAALTAEGRSESWQVAAATCLLAVISVYVNSGLGTIFSVFNLPAFNMPFNLTIFVFLGALGAGNSHFFNGGGGATDFTALGQDSGYNSYDVSVTEAIPKALSQIYGSAELTPGILILVAMFVDSPTIGIFAVLAGGVSILTAMLINVPTAAIASGAWSYNAVLVTCSAAGFFWVLSWQTAILALFSGVFATLVHGLLVRLLVAPNVPAVAFAFNIAGFIFMAVGSNNPLFKRTPMDQITYPEEHYLKWGSKNRISDGAI